MTALRTHPTCIGWGISSALGPSARHTGFYLRASRNNFSLSPFVDVLGDPVTVSCATTLPKDLTGPERLFALAKPALKEAFTTVGQYLKGQRLRACLALPARHAGSGGRGLNPDGQKLLAMLLEESVLREHPTDVIPFPAGGSAGAPAAAHAADLLASGEAEFVFLLGVDSYYDWGVLEHLAKQDRLLTPDNVDGLRPGEAAACLVLAAPGHAFARSAGMSRIVATGEGREPSLPGVDEPPNMAHGFTAALREAVAPLRERRVRTNSWFSDITHDDYRVREFQILLARFGDVAGQNMSLVTPARELGEVGAATLPLYAALATEAWHRGYAADATALCMAASEDGRRGALLLEEA
jgi:hypothetical protein